MNYFSIIKDSDIFDSPALEPKEYTSRPTAKGIVLDEKGRIAFISNGEHSLFPGGGVEEDETYEEAFVRECMEEIGCSVDISATLGKALQYRARNITKYEVEFFVSHVIGSKGSPTTQEKGELACVLSWLTEEEVVDILEKQISEIREDDYPAHFNCRTHLAAFKKYRETKR